MNTGQNKCSRMQDRNLGASAVNLISLNSETQSQPSPALDVRKCGRADCRPEMVLGPVNKIECSACGFSVMNRPNKCNGMQELTRTFNEAMKIKEMLGD